MTFRDLIDSPIAYHRCFVAIAGSVSGAVFLSQVCYWSKRTKREDGFFYKTAEEWEQETGIPQRTQDRIRTALRLKGILIEKLIGVPATLYFKLDVEALLNLFPDSPSGETEIRQVANHLDSPSGETISRITTETTLHELPDLKFPKPEKRTKAKVGFQRNQSRQAPREFVNYAALRREEEEKAHRDQYDLIARVARECAARVGRPTQSQGHRKSD